MLFPSTEWLTAVATLAMQDDAYRHFGRVDALVGLKIGDRTFRLSFDVFDITDIREIDVDELRDLDFYLEMEPARWQSMLQSIKEYDRAEREFTLNSLDLTLRDGLHFNAAGDGYRADKFFRYNENLQRFFDLSARVETSFDPSPASGAASSPSQ
jgi:hypothetical protein